MAEQPAGRVSTGSPAAGASTGVSTAPPAASAGVSAAPPSPSPSLPIAPGVAGVSGISATVSYSNGVAVASQPVAPGVPSVTPISPSVAVSPTIGLLSSTSLISGPVSGSKNSISSSESTKSQTPPSGSAGQARPSTTPTPKSDHGLASGTVAGIAVAVGLGLALATFIATFLVMRRRRTSRRKQTVFELADTNRQNSLSEPKKMLATEAPKPSNTLEDYLPQSADDKTVENNVKTMLDQVELYVENFYRNDPGLSSVRLHTDMAVFNSPHLPNSLATLLLQSTHATFLIKHALAQCITSSISPRSRPGSSLLPDEFILVPTAAESTRNSESKKPGFDQCMSRWRVLTAYLRPAPSQDTVYIAQRNDRIQETVELFSRAFAPWRNLKHEDKVRNQSLSAILRSAADLGIFMFSQPSDLRFHWPKQSGVGANRVVVAPSLIKMTDEKGQALAESQVMLKAVIERI